MKFLTNNDEEYHFAGNHFIASYLECDFKALTDVKQLRDTFLQAAKNSGATLLSHTDHVFPGNGFTMVVLLSESHASIHTYPEHNACFVDLFTCGDHCHATPFSETLEKYLSPAQISHKKLIRTDSICEHC